MRQDQPRFPRFPSHPSRVIGPVTPTTHVRTVHLPHVCGAVTSRGVLSPTLMWPPSPMASVWSGPHRRASVQVGSFSKALIMYPLTFSMLLVTYVDSRDVYLYI